MRMKWYRVEDDVPDYRVDVLIYGEGGYAIGHCGKGGITWQTITGHEIHPSYWAHLPNPKHLNVLSGGCG